MVLRRSAFLRAAALLAAVIVLPIVARARCPLGEASCMERGFKLRDACLDRCFRPVARLFDPDNPDDVEGCNKGCLEERKKWVQCCRASDDCGAKCEVKWSKD